MSEPSREGWLDRARRHRVWIVAGVVVLALAIWLVVRGGGGGEAGGGETPVVQASTAAAVIEDFPVTVAALGTVVPGPGAEARPSAPAATRVTRVLVAEGDAVTAGQPLIALDASVFSAQLDQARAAVTSAEQARDRAQRLVDQGISPRKELESAQSDLARARAAMAEARRNSAMATVRSPIAGIVTAVDVAIGQPVDSNQPLVDIVNSAGLSIDFRVSPEDAARIARGADVSLSSVGSSVGPEQTAALGHGTVAGVSAAVDPATASVQVRVVATSPTRRLRAGESVAGRITVDVHHDAVVVPAAALVPGDEGVHVFVVDAQGIAHETPVEVGGRSDAAVEIVSGLKGGERVVTDGAYGVSDGARVEVPADSSAGSET